MPPANITLGPIRQSSGKGHHADAFVPGHTNRVACINAWYGHPSSEVVGYGWLILPYGGQIGIPRCIVPVDKLVSTFEDAVTWLDWYIGEYRKT